jgi:putative peptidoglycan binding protein
MSVGWWETHRQLQRGDRGPDVAALQRMLIEDSGDKFPVTGFFDIATENSVKEFQERNNLSQDGIVGPVTHSILFDGNYHFEIMRPKLMRQEQFTCWAASMESALQSNWGARPRLTVADMLRNYSSFLAPRKDITIAGFNKLVIDISAFQTVVDGRQFPLEQVLRELGRNLSPVVLVHDLTGAIAHTVVIFGVRIVKGQASLIVMDPLDGAYEDLGVEILRGFTSQLRIVSAHALM